MTEYHTLKWDGRSIETVRQFLGELWFGVSLDGNGDMVLWFSDSTGYHPVCSGEWLVLCEGVCGIRALDDAVYWIRS